MSGTIVDINEARVAGARVTVESGGVTRTVITAEDGTYEIELPVGIHRISVSSRGFCAARRAPFRVQPSNTIVLNFTLISCPIAYGITVVDDQSTGDTSRYKDPFKEEAFSLDHSSGAPLELLVRYGRRRVSQNMIEYQGTDVSYDEYANNPAGSLSRSKYMGATVSYGLLTVSADKIRLNPKTFLLEAEGNVVVEDGKQRIRASRAVVDLQTDEPNLALTP